MRADAPTNTDPAKAAKRRDRAYWIAQCASTSTFIPPPADFADEISEDEEEEDADEDEGEAEVEILDEETEAPLVQAPGAPVAPETASEPPVVPGQDSSSPMYHSP
jgi:hypothetical protein